MHDFQHHYGLNWDDIWSGEIQPARALELINGLMNVPDSQFVASRADGDVWPSLHRMVADVHDVLVLIASANGLKNPQGHFFRRPRFGKKHVEDRPKTIAEFDVGGFLRKINQR